MSNSLTGYFDRSQIADRRAYVSRNKIALALKGLEYFFMTYGEGIKQPENPGQIEGRTLHLATLEPEEWRRRKLVHRFDNLKTTEARAWQIQRLRENPDGIVMSLQEALRYDRIVDRIMSHRRAGPLIRNAMREKHGYAVCPRTGLQLYSRPDILTPDREVGELKFARSADPFDFGRDQHKNKWFMQLAFYNFVDGLISGKRNTGNCFYIVVEQNYPHRIAVLTLHADFEAMGEALFNEGLDKIQACLKLDPEIKNYEIWRALSNITREICPEPWMLDRSPALQNLHGTIGG